MRARRSHPEYVSMLRDDRSPNRSLLTKFPHVPTGTFQIAENLRRKLLILRAGSCVGQWMQGVRLRRECLLSRMSVDYESGLDRLGL